MFPFFDIVLPHSRILDLYEYMWSITNQKKAEGGGRKAEWEKVESRNSEGESIENWKLKIENWELFITSRWYSNKCKFILPSTLYLLPYKIVIRNCPQFFQEA